MAGACMLWVGWFGFNAGSALTAGADAGMAMTVTHISAATATLVWIVIEWCKFGKPSVVGAVTGAVAGLATITPASGYVGPGAALVIGFAGGTICYFMVGVVKRRFKIDDSLDVFAVHGVGGATGVLLTAVFMDAALGGVGFPEGGSMGGAGGCSDHRHRCDPALVSRGKLRHRQGGPGPDRLAGQRRDRGARPRRQGSRRARLQYVTASERGRAS